VVVVVGATVVVVSGACDIIEVVVASGACDIIEEPLVGGTEVGLLLGVEGIALVVLIVPLPFVVETGGGADFVPLCSNPVGDLPLLAGPKNSAFTTVAPGLGSKRSTWVPLDFSVP